MIRAKRTSAKCAIKRERTWYNIARYYTAWMGIGYHTIVRERTWYNVDRHYTRRSAHECHTMMRMHMV